MDPDQLFSARRVLAAHRLGFTRGQLRASGFEHPVRGVVRQAGSDIDPLTEHLSTAIALLTDHCVIGGWAALRIQGNTWFDGWSEDGLRPVLVHCEPGSRLRLRVEIRPFRGLLHPDEWDRLESLPLATLPRAAFDEMRMASSVREAVVVVDMACSTTTAGARTTIDAIRRVISSHHKIRGIVQATAALELASDRSASPWETRTRMLAHFDADLRGLLVNVPVFGPDKALLGVADLLDEESGLVVESDGAHHREADQHAEDNRREEGFERAGLVVVRVSSLDHSDRAGTGRRLRRAHRDALSTPRKDWTLDQPDWWRTSQISRRWR